MNVADLIQNLTERQFRGLVVDFNRLQECRKRSQVAGKSQASMPAERKYRAVLHTLRKAEAAARRGDDANCHFFNGMAAAFYGLVRLAEARELKAALGPALGLSSSDEKADETSRKEAIVPQTEQMQFSLDKLGEFFDADDVKYVADWDKGILMAGFCGEFGPVHFVGQVSTKTNILLLLFKLPLVVPEDRRSEAALGVVRANYGLLVGSFELDLSDGELNYKVVLPTDDATISHEQFRHCMGGAFSTISRYMPAFHRIVFADATADEAITAVEA